MTGRHRRSGRTALTIRTTGGAVAGAAVLGTAAATTGTAIALTAALTSAPVPAGNSVPANARAAHSAVTTRAADRQASRSATTPLTRAPGRQADSTTDEEPAESRDRDLDPTRRRAKERDDSRTAPERTRPKSQEQADTQDRSRNRDRSSTGGPDATGGADRTGRAETTAGRSAEAGTEPGTPASGRPGTTWSTPRRPAAPAAPPVVTAETAYRTKVEFRRPARRVTADDVIGFARRQVGVREDSWGRTKYQEWYAGSPGAQETAERDRGLATSYLTAPWCDMFVSWIGEQTGTGRSVGSDAYTVDHARWFVTEGRWGVRPRPGALVFFAWETDARSRDIPHIDHVGLVIRDNGDGTIETVEGNSRNAVEIRTRSVSWVAGYGYPGFAR